MSNVIVITSGKGGTGKTSLTAGVGSCLAALGKQVLCIDMDVGLRNLDLSLGLSDRALMDFTDVLCGRCTLERAAVPHPVVHGLNLLTAPVTLPRQPLSRAAMQELLRQAREQYDFILMDSPAGLGEGFRLACCGADRAVVVGPDGLAVQTLELTRPVLDLSAAGSYCALLTGSDLIIYTRDLTPYAALDDPQGARLVDLAADGSALLADSQQAWLFLPG